MDLQKDLLSYQDIKDDSIFEQKRKICLESLTQTVLDVLKLEHVHWTLKRRHKQTQRLLKVKDVRQLTRYTVEHVYNLFFKSAKLLEVKFIEDELDSNVKMMLCIKTSREDGFDYELFLVIEKKQFMTESDEEKRRVLDKMFRERTDINRLFYACCLNNVLNYKRDCFTASVKPRVETDPESEMEWMMFGIDNINIVGDFSHIVWENFVRDLRDKKKEFKNEALKENKQKQCLDRVLQLSVQGSQMSFGFDKLGTFYYDLDALFNLIVQNIVVTSAKK